MSETYNSPPSDPTHVRPCRCCGSTEVHELILKMFPRPYDGGGWPGDGSGMDDLADFNAMEGMDM
jgi:hypothetical protein